MRSLLCLLVLALATGGQSQTSPPAIGATPSTQHYDGKWWTTADGEERSGFLNGAADCLTWTAHEKGFNGTPEQLATKITNFYKVHPESVGHAIIDVWRILIEQPPSSKGNDTHGERWENPHWYLNGDWWSQESEGQQLGFVEGYLWCMRTEVRAPTESYSGSASLYQQKIDAFVRANPKYGLEAVATTLRRFKDKSTPVAPK